MNIKNNYNEIPLHGASRGENIGVVKLLLEHGSDVNVKNNNGRYPLYYIRKFENNEIMELLRRFQFTQTGNDELVDDYVNSFNSC